MFVDDSAQHQPVNQSEPRGAGELDVIHHNAIMKGRALHQQMHLLRIPDLLRKTP